MKDFAVSREFLETCLRDANLVRFQFDQHVFDLQNLLNDAPSLPNILKYAYNWGYGAGQDNPNGYCDEVERDRCIADLLGDGDDNDE